MSQITVHILDTTSGKPAAEMQVTLSELINNKWHPIAESTSNDQGRIADLLPPEKLLPAGTYQMRFATEPYLLKHNYPVFYPKVEVVFNITASGEHYHIPLLLSAFGYSTYRGS